MLFRPLGASSVYRVRYLCKESDLRDDTSDRLTFLQNVVHLRYGQCTMDLPELGSAIHQLEEDVAGFV
jgi:hypothetical protein